MTCILALEASDPSRKITVSSQAASQPKVPSWNDRRTVFYLKIFFIPLCWNPHNDAAVAIAEGIDGSVEAFAQRMNQKAEEIGCEKYIFHFSQWIGCTGFSKQSSYYSPGTCTDPALLHYDFAPSVRPFLKITRTMQYTFQDCAKELFLIPVITTMRFLI